MYFSLKKKIHYNALLNVHLINITLVVISKACLINFIKNVPILIICPCNVHPLTPHFYIVKLGLTREYIISYFFSKAKIVGTR